MAELIENIQLETLQENLALALQRIEQAAAKAGQDSGKVQLLAAVKYVPIDSLPLLAEAGIKLVGENRVQDLIQKHHRYGDLFQWDFIGQLQSRKVKQILPLVRTLHSVASDSAIQQILKHAGSATEIMLQINVSEDPNKAGFSPRQLPQLLEQVGHLTTGLMTMPPLTADPELNRPHFAALKQLADRYGLKRLSMGTSQDYTVAVEEGATVVRIGSTLFRRSDR